jgi:hypothetical protein
MTQRNPSQQAILAWCIHAATRVMAQKWRAQPKITLKCGKLRNLCVLENVNVTKPN